MKNQLKNEKDKKENVEKELKKANRAFKEIKKVNSPIYRREFFPLPPPVRGKRLYEPCDPYYDPYDPYDIYDFLTYPI